MHWACCSRNVVVAGTRVANGGGQLQPLLRLAAHRWAMLASHTGASSVCCCTVQGCGRSEGKRGLRFFCESFDDYVADVLQLARCAASASLGVWV